MTGPFALSIEGDAGPIETYLDPAESPAVATAVLLHPHPLHGGSLHDGVLDTVSVPLRASAIDVVRFNFRGVGASAGRHDDGVGEADDAVRVCEHLRSRAPDTPLLLIGYSFGSAVAWRAAARIRPARLVLVAPPVTHLAYEGEAPDGVPVDVIVGDADDFVPVDALRAWCDARGARALVLPGADHFFSGAETGLGGAVARLLGDAA